MQSKILLKWSLSIIAIAGSIFSLMIIFFPDFNPLNRSYYVKSSLPDSGQNSQNLNDSKLAELMRVIISPEKVRSDLPIRLKIPAINVNADIESLGITSGGEMVIPKGPAGVAWFNLGPRPGEDGSAVISGHYGWKNGIPAVFDNLNKLQKGDKVYVEDENGKSIAFVVREIRSYGESADAPDVFSSNDGKAHLNFITCEGIWNKFSKSYSKRLVVFTDKE